MANSVALSIIVPTRDRGAYLGACLQTCLNTPLQSIEVLVLDNASVDETASVVAAIDDARLHYHPSDVRLSMRQNFERGLELAQGDILCFLGDDDGLVPRAIEAVLEWMADPSVGAVSNQRAHYGWPDFNESRRNTLLIPRGQRQTRLTSRAELRGMLGHIDYYRLPCLYHGFVRRDLVERIRQRDGGFFHSSQVDMYSVIALSCEDITYIRSERPLVVNGGSRRSNGASYQGQTGGEEKARWVKEDDVGFFPGFENPISVGCAVLESALRYCRLRSLTMSDLFERHSIVDTAAREVALRVSSGRDEQDSVAMLRALDITDAEITGAGRENGRLKKRVTSFLGMRPIDARAEGIINVNGAAQFVGASLRNGSNSIWADPVRQMKAALMFSRGSKG